MKLKKNSFCNNLTDSENVTNLKMHYAYVPFPHDKCTYYVSETCTNKKGENVSNLFLGNLKLKATITIWSWCVLHIRDNVMMENV